MITLILFPAPIYVMFYWRQNEVEAFLTERNKFLEDQSEKGFDAKLQKKYELFLKQIKMRLYAFRLFTFMMCLS